MRKKGFQLISSLLAVMLLLSIFNITALAVSKIVLTDGSAVPSTVLVGQTYALKVSDNTKVKFSGDNTKIATVSEAGVLKPIAPGKVTITAKEAGTDDIAATRTFTVLQRATSVSVGVETIYLSQGDRYMLKPMLMPATSTDVIRFTSDNTGIAAVGQISGTVTAKALGETTITIYAKEKTTISRTDPGNLTTTVKVVVREKSLKADVLKENQIKLTFSEDITGVAAKNFSVIQTNTMNVSKTLEIENLVRNSSREFLLTMAEPVFSETETSMATLYFTSPNDENHIIIVNLGKKYADTSEPTSVTKSGNTRIEAGTSSFLQFFGVDKNGDSYPLDNVTVSLYSYVTNAWTVVPESGAVVNKVSFRYKLLSDGSLMVTYTAPLDAVTGTIAIQLKKENGKSFPASSLLINSATQNAKYSLRFVSPEGEELFEPLTVSAGTSLDTPTPAREGYTFKKWVRSDGKEDIVRLLMPEYDLTLTAVWEYTPSAQTASVSAGNWTYGNPVSPTLNNCPADASKVTYQYKAVGTEDTEWSTTVPTVPGNYQVRAVIEKSEGATITTAVVYFTISPKELTVTGLTATDRAYEPNNFDAALDFGNAKLSGVVGSDDVELVTADAVGVIDDENAGINKEVTVSGLALTGANAANYTLAQPDDVTVNINKATQNITILMEDDSWVYDKGAESHAPTLTPLPSSHDGEGNVKYQYKLTSDTNWTDWTDFSVPTNAGKYQVRAVIAETDNYFETITSPADFTIKPKEVTVIGTAVRPSKVYDDSADAEITDVGTLSGVCDGDRLTIVKGKAAYNDKNVGNQKIVTFTDFALDGADKGNYVLKSQPESVTADITERTDVISVDITWDSVEFIYTAPCRGTWNPETHQYEGAAEGGWSAEGGNFTVQNNGDVGVSANFSYTSAEGMSEISGSFNNSVLTLAPNDSGVSKLSISGKPSARFENRELGTVKVSVYKYGWISINDKYYYYDGSGSAVTGWKNDIPGFEGKWFYFDDSGIMSKGWKTDIPEWGDAWFYFGNDGVMCTGWVELDGMWYYFGENGQLVKSSAEAPVES